MDTADSTIAAKLPKLEAMDGGPPLVDPREMSDDVLRAAGISRPPVYDVDISKGPPVLRRLVRLIELTKDAAVLAEARAQWPADFTNSHPNVPIDAESWTSWTQDARKRLAGLAVGLAMGVSVPPAGRVQLEALQLAMRLGKAAEDRPSRGAEARQNAARKAKRQAVRKARRKNRG